MPGGFSYNVGNIDFSIFPEFQRMLRILLRSLCSKLVGIVIEITLNVDKRCTFVAAAAGQVA